MGVIDDYKAGINSDIRDQHEEDTIPEQRVAKGFTDLADIIVQLLVDAAETSEAITADKIYNALDLAADQEGYVLDARQGKVLNDAGIANSQSIADIVAELAAFFATVYIQEDGSILIAQNLQVTGVTKTQNKVLVSGKIAEESYTGEFYNEPIIDLAIGDFATGFTWEGVGLLAYYAAGVRLFGLADLANITNPKSRLPVPNALSIDWQNEEVPEGGLTWVQKFGNDLFAHTDWFLNPETGKYEVYTGLAFSPTYDGETLLTVDISSPIYPCKTIIS